MGSTTEDESFNKTGHEEAPSNSKEKGPKSLLRKLLDLLLALGVWVFLDDRGTAWGWARLNEYYQPLSLRSDQFGAFCQTAYFAEYDDAISDGVIKKAATFLKHTARERHPLHNRFAYLDGELWVDLGTDTGKVVVVTRDGWGTTSPIVPVFRRFSHQKPLPLPKPDGRVEDILNFLPLKNADEQKLILVWICSLPLEHIQRPLLLLYGSPRSGKSTCSEIIRDSIDPSCTLTLSFPQGRSELIQALDHNALPVYDNIERLPKWASPEICRAVTGGGFSKRTLYSDDDDTVFRFRRSAILNGINLPSHAPDVLDRSIIIRLERLTDRECALLGGEEELKQRFRDARPGIFGGILNILSAAMKIKPTVKLEKLQRMDSWELWGCAIAQALGIAQEEFLKAYHANISRHHEELLGTDPVCLAVVQLMSSRLLWQGSPSKLYSELAAIAKTEGHDKEATWPKAPNSLTRRINELKESLAAAGVAVSQPRTKSQRLVILSRSESDSSQEIPSSSSSETTNSPGQSVDDDDSDDDFSVSTGHKPSPTTQQEYGEMSV
ncbi:MAG: hypothetical protein ACLP5H_04190 [Desulfomonilaceae bacterium]